MYDCCYDCHMKQPTPAPQRGLIVSYSPDMVVVVLTRTPCATHPRYQAKKRPTSACERCWEYWLTRAYHAG